ncbi:hypothetical protein [Paracidovorax oryzae]|uniref:hypothetical protein n=1 Tax=Paracidovorax oryzae TaxID=862720 RepID=UPI00192BE18C|nr:hypothetical protein [Paracidovorax oryzae]
MSFVDIIAVVPTVADNGGAISDAFSGETTGSIAAPGLAAGNIVAAISAPFIGLTVSGQMSGILAGFTIIKISAELSHDVPPGSIGLGDIIQVVAGAVTVTAAVAAATTGVVAAAPLLGVLGLTAAVAQLVANQNGYTADSVINAISPSTNKKYLEARNWTPPRDPLVLDLDGDGIEAIGIDPTRPILFDHDGDGRRRRWPGRQERTGGSRNGAARCPHQAGPDPYLWPGDARPGNCKGLRQNAAVAYK